MNKGTLFRIAASSLVIGAGVSAIAVDVNARSAASANAAAAKGAVGAAKQASKLLAKGKVEKAIRFAEAAVAGSPTDAGYRALLGQAYLAGGRFQSARAALADAVALDPTNGRAVLNLALAQIALAQNDDALETLNAANGNIAPADFGLALALAGDIDNAVQTLEGAARAPDAGARARQNLALAYALANRWGEARVVAAQDLAADQLDRRMTEWAAFVRPKTSWDQVASLLGVKAVWDPGLPIQLALSRNAQPTALTAADPALGAGSEPVAEPEVAVAAIGGSGNGQTFELPEPEAPKPALAAAVTEAPAVVPKPAPAIIPVAVPAPVRAPSLIKAEPSPLKQAVVPAGNAMGGTFKRVSAIESGKFVVQLGAFSSEARAQAAWKSAGAKTRELNNYDVAMPRVQVNGAALYRLSVSGFVTKEAAGQVCARVKAAGGQCFIRSVTDTKPLQWAAKGKGPTRIAAR